MSFPVATLLATNVFFDPVVGLLHQGQVLIFGLVRNYGWTMILIAAIVKIAFWQLNTMQFKSMLAMQKLQAPLKALKERYGKDPEKLNTETMALYKEQGVNPLAGCFPLLVQMPVLIGMYWSVLQHKDMFMKQGWLWIGSAFANVSPVVSAAVLAPAKDAHPAFHVLASDLASPDYVLLGFYMISMYFQMRLTTPATDPAMAQQQRIMAFVSPAMIGFFGFKYAWPSAMILYWLSFNAFTMAQQFYLIRKYHANPTAAGPLPDALVPAGAKVQPAGVPLAPANSNGSSSRAARKRRSSRR